MNSNPGSSLADLKNFASNTANIDDIISLDISDLGNGSNSTHKLDMDLLANHSKAPSPKTPLVSASAYTPSGSTFNLNNSPAVQTSEPSLASSGIEFVNIEDTQKVISLALDCDGDALLITVEQTGAACHTGEKTCFHKPIELS